MLDGGSSVFVEFYDIEVTNIVTVVIDGDGPVAVIFARIIIVFFGPVYITGDVLVAANVSVVLVDIGSGYIVEVIAASGNGCRSRCVVTSAWLLVTSD